MAYLLAKLHIIKLRLYSLGFTPINLMIFFIVLRIIYIIIIFFLRNDFNLEFVNSINSMIDIKNINFNVYFNFEEIFCFFMYTYLVDISEGSYPIFSERIPGVLLMESNAGQSSSNNYGGWTPINSNSQDLSDISDLDESGRNLKVYTFTADEYKRILSLDNDKLIREFDPRLLRKFSFTVRDSDFYKHLNSPTNHKFQNALGKNIRKRLDIVLSCHNDNYEAANKDMNQTINDPKGRLWYDGRSKPFSKVKYLSDPKDEWNY